MLGREGELEELQNSPPRLLACLPPLWALETVYSPGPCMNLELHNHSFAGPVDGVAEGSGCGRYGQVRHILVPHMGK